MDLKTSLILANRHWDRLGLVPPIRRDRFGEITRDMDQHLMALITGPRRVGKSVLMRQLMSYLIKERGIAPRQILWFEFSPRQETDLVPEIVNYFNREVADFGRQRYIFLDEIQFVRDYEIAIKLIYDQDPLAKIFITGSLSLSYKRRMAESLAGRFLPYRMYPLNFFEYLRLIESPLAEEFKSFKLESDEWKRKGSLERLNAAFREFLHVGRLPMELPLSPEGYASYLEGIVFQSLSQDSLAYFGIERADVIAAIYEYIRTRSGMELSVEKMATEVRVPRATVSRYLDILEIMGMVYFVYNSRNPLVKLNSRRKAYVNSAFYLKDPHHDLLTAMGFAAESYVLERLLEQGKQVTFYRKRGVEVDFVLPQEKTAYEVKFSQQYDLVRNPLKGYALQVADLMGDSPVCML